MATDPPPPSGLPRRFGPYTALDVIARGVAAVVYRAADAEGTTVVAVKTLPAGFTAADLERFGDEVMRLQRAGYNSDRVVRVHDRGFEGACPYLVMEFVPGGSLAGRLDRARRLGVRLDPLFACRVVRDAAAGAAGFHADGFLHRDIKPANVLLGRGGGLLCDIGTGHPLRPTGRWAALATAFGRRGPATPPAGAWGTPPYDDPWRADDARADVYSLGAVLYECLTGRPPPRPLAAERDLDGLSHLAWGPDTPPLLRGLCENCLTRPKFRHKTTARLVEELDRVLADPAGYGMSEAPDGPAGPDAAQPPAVGAGVPPPPRPPRSRAVLAARAAVTLCALIAVMVVGLVRLPWPRSPETVATTATAALTTPKLPTSPATRPLEEPLRRELAPMPRPVFVPKPAPTAADEVAVVLPPPSWFGPPAAEAKPGPRPEQPAGFPRDPRPGYVHKVAVPGTLDTVVAVCWVPPDGERRGFWMERTEVTQAEWTALGGPPNPSTITRQPTYKNFRDADLGRHPVETVTWPAAVGFCDRLAAATGLAVRLPTRDEWVWAARGGTPTDYHTGDGEAALGRAGWYLKNSGRFTHPVGQKEANAYGLVDMLGNVAEWADDDLTHQAPFMGGYWGSKAAECGPEAFLMYDKEETGDGVGFRVVVPLVEPGRLPEKPPGP